MITKDNHIFKEAGHKEVLMRKKIYQKQITEEWVQNFLKREDIECRPNGSYDVFGDVDLQELGFKKIPLQFNAVYGDFCCIDNCLTSLEGCPQYIGGNFMCSYNFLESLKFGPKEVKGQYICCDNRKIFPVDLIANLCLTERDHIVNM